MKINQILKLVSDSTYIYFGTQKGTNWIWICRKKELEEQIAPFDKIFYEAKQKALKRQLKLLPDVEADLAKAQAELQEIWAPFKKAKKKNEPLKQQIDAKKVQVGKIEARRKEIVDCISYLEKQLKAGIHLMDRNVVEVIPHTQDKPGLGIIVEGDECGKYWFFNEVELELKKNSAIDNLYYNVAKAG